MSYSYWLLRYVPDTVRGEFVNIGVIVGDDDRADWAIRTVESFVRANRLGGDASLSKSWLDRLVQRVAANQDTNAQLYPVALDTGISRSWLDRQRSRLNNSVQISPPTPVATADAASAADLLFSRLVNEAAREERSTSRTRLVKNLRSRFEQTGRLQLGMNLQAKAEATVGRQHGQFDFAVGDRRAMQLTQAWAFQVKDLPRVDEMVRSWNYLAGRIRDEGANISGFGLGARSALVSPDVPIWAVHDEPTTDAQRESLLVAQEAWSKLGVRSVSSAEASVVAAEAAGLVMAAA
ncbi:DUF3037 domain-containing protein [Microbacteriaceae bacterium VKM Ac-2854]|nr:DUF3037 domain-containing protein [Microbacteriaceae bacterium VKM Ac-2854]